MKRILCVDDSRTSRMIVADVVKKLGFEIIEAVDGVDGINQVSADQFDLVILDINMPNLNGVEMLEGMRMQSDRTPVLITTADVPESTVASLRRMGIDDLLLKPFKADDLREKILKSLKMPTDDQAAEGAAPVAVKQAEILILSDMQVIHQKLRELIPQELPIDACHKATECVLACRKHHYKLVFFDSGITESNLTALWEQLRNVLPHAVFVGMAMHNDGRMEAELRRMNFDEILLRPFEEDRVRTLVDQGCAFFAKSVAAEKNVIRIAPLLVARKRFDEFYNFVKVRIGEVLHDSAEACESLVIVDLSQLSDLDATWVTRLLAEIGQSARNMEMELRTVGTGPVVSGAAAKGVPCYASLQAALAASA